MKSFIIKLAVFTAGCFLFSFVAAKIAGVDKYPENLVERYALKFREGKKVSFTKKFTMAGAEELELETRSGDVELLYADEPNDFTAVVEGIFEGTPEQILQADMLGKKLVMKLNENRNKSGFSIDFENELKALTLKIPRSVKKVSLKTVNGDLHAKKMKLETIAMGATSGDLELEEFELASLEAATVSGDVSCQNCKIGTLESKTTSGDVSLTLKNGDVNLVATTTSGGVELKFSEKPSARLEFTATSGDLNLDPDFGKAEEDAKSASIKIGAGKGKLLITTTSGDVTIGKK